MYHFLVNLNCDPIPGSGKINLVGCWPFMVGPIDLNMSLNDEYVTFNCTFVFDYYLDDDYDCQDLTNTIPVNIYQSNIADDILKSVKYNL